MRERLIAHVCGSQCNKSSERPCKVKPHGVKFVVNVREAAMTDKVGIVHPDLCRYYTHIKHGTHPFGQRPE